MPRRPDPTRKPELLGQILEHLRGRSLATVSFRTLAEALGVSTYVFVYHFGNRAQLIGEVVQAIVARNDALLGADTRDLEPEAFAKHLGKLWSEVSSERGRDLQRLEFEAALLETVAGDDAGVARAAVTRWHDVATGWLTAHGVATADAKVEGRLFADAVYGLQFDSIVTDDHRRVTAAFKRLADSFVAQV
ncbi:TetR/AcrR family transcriptional regulator [Frigoribacterium sp. 2-23]|uniref:TetR/AcrR family transcriptional regulator n=1 Tax=Frigoribacterium sp. 2-23 TaxID=3415006 RepID=UPI003C6EE76C